MRSKPRSQMMASRCMRALLMVSVLVTQKLWQSRAEASEVYPMVKVKAGRISYEVPVASPKGLQNVRREALVQHDFEIGRYEVSNLLWDECFKRHGCKKRSLIKNQENAKNPATRLSWHDAYTFTKWWSATTNESYRLPTEDEWMLAAKDERAQLSQNGNYVDKALQILAPKISHPLGHFGQNSRGIFDLIGNVWEWTLTCWQGSPNAVQFAQNANELNNADVCSLRIVVGGSRAHLQDFISDAYTGGCSGQRAPSNLGFRMVREEEK